MKQFVINGLAVVGAGCIAFKLTCVILDRYKDNILDYAAETLMDYLVDETDDAEKSPKDKMKKKLLVAYLKKGAESK